ncbi:hypothetical protein SELMODRAFT_183257 [Selaginella moellendorffii]|uniref:Alpha-MPP n=1 Tax=Selaginella moellendorffii TaxID=88036 RepID=D8SW59_SELML|nr:mitochondrial-processing peptidase subunit alpha [Selaginella moellendorffii]EFJ11431.1 hypothetical protein SELMODRAFT_183257 [Selaginella moellendorffii]|eukprot:XP_002987595.1 mitochondrial-processing peptidase subunit alpha [Selaginella moellendorffii]
MVVRAALHRRLGQYKAQARGFHASTPFSQAVPALRTPSKGWLSWLFREPLPTLPALYEALPEVNLPPSLEDTVEPSGTQISSLNNGVRIASEQIAGPTATLGIYVDSGSIHEDASNSGATHLLERMAFKSTHNRSHFRLTREVEAIGGNIMASATREQMAYTGDTIKTYMPQMVELLVDSVRNPAFHGWEVHEQVDKIKAELAEMFNNPQSILLEALHSAGYSGPIGHPLLASESALSKLDGATLTDFVRNNFIPRRIVLAASGVDHEELMAVAEPLLTDWPSGKGVDCGPSEYIGGDWRGTADSPTTHIALAFEVPGGWRNEHDSFAVTVLQTLLGGGGSFSSGGPGKGMYSRLYTRVLNHYDKVQSFTAFNSIYNDTGIFGIHATSTSDFVPNLIDLATDELTTVATGGEVTEEELERAKNATISAVLMNLESRVVVTEDIGRQILTYGKRKPIQDFISAVQGLTLENITSTASKLLSSPLTMASWGDVVHVPRYEEVARRFKK